MRITESRLRRIIRSVINETNKYEREVNNRKNREYRNLPFTMSQEQIQAKEDEEAKGRDIERCAGQLAKLYRSLIQKEQKEFSRDSKRLYIRIVLAAGSHLFYQNKPTEQEIEEARKELLKVSNMSSFDKYLESDSFWRGVHGIFKIDTMLDTMSEKELKVFFS